MSIPLRAGAVLGAVVRYRGVRFWVRVRVRFKKNIECGSGAGAGAVQKGKLGAGACARAVQKGKWVRVQMRGRSKNQN